MLLDRASLRALEAPWVAVERLADVKRLLDRGARRRDALAALAARLDFRAAAPHLNGNS